MKESPLRDCRACGKKISRFSPFCRHCGHPQGSALMIWLLSLFGVLLLAIYLAFCCYGMRWVR